MRIVSVGLLLLALSATAQAQAEGQIESIGFQGYYRSSACVPMKLRLRSTIASAATYRLAVLQQDMDGDRVLYWRPLTLNGNPEGSRLEQRVWVYFLPQPRGLRQARTAQELNGLVRVFLCTPGGNQLMQIPFPSNAVLPRDLEEPGGFGAPRGVRLVLTVGTSQSRPFRDVYRKARGITEEVLLVPVSLDELPENPVGYQAVDAIVWLNADPGQLRSETASAIREYVWSGGRLVVCQNPQLWREMQNSELADMLPVQLRAVRQEADLVSLRELAGLGALRFDPWPDLRRKNFPVVSGELREDALFVMRQAGYAQSPYLARRMYGSGLVSWVAQDFGDPAILSGSATRQWGWTTVWERIFDWRNTPVTPDMVDADPSLEPVYHQVYREVNSITDLSRAVLSGMEAPSTGAAYVALAVLFFIVYWLIAGPGTYFLLLRYRQVQYSWPAFALVAVAGTAVTVLLVRLVLRGPPQLYHISFVRVMPDGHSRIDSRIGLYVKQNATQRIELRGNSSQHMSYIWPYPAHPDHQQESSGFTAYKEYEVPIRDRAVAGNPGIDVPFRSTLKRFAVRWVGPATGEITGSAELIDNSLAGYLTNNTGRDLHSVYLIYRAAYTQAERMQEDDWLLRVPGRAGQPAWPRGQRWNLAEIHARLGPLWRDRSGPSERNYIGDRGLLNLHWMAKEQWGGTLLRYSQPDLETACVLLSVYDRIRPCRGENRPGAYDDRYELLRRDSRYLDASNAVSCGHLLILARSEEPAPLPFPLLVQGRAVASQGVIYYAFAVPLQHLSPPTQPSQPEQLTRSSQSRAG